MDFALPEELQMLQDTVRKFVDQELIPVEMECRDGVTLKPEYRERFEAKTREMGLWMLDVPEEFGGAGLSLMAQVIIWAEVARSVAIPSRGRSIFGPEVRPVLYAMNEEQKDRYLYPLLKDEKRACFAQTEPDAGSDPGSMRTRAVRDGDEYVINGVKRFITEADEADFAQVMVATDPEKGSHGGISCILVDMDNPGVKITAKYKTHDGLRAVRDRIRRLPGAGGEHDRRGGRGL